MWIEEWVSPQNTFGVSGVNSVAAKSNTFEVKKTEIKQQGKHIKCLHTASVVSKVFVSTDIQIRLETPKVFCEF